jgi:hypothetical protein
MLGREKGFACHIGALLQNDPKRRCGHFVLESGVKARMAVKMYEAASNIKEQEIERTGQYYRGLPGRLLKTFALGSSNGLLSHPGR